MENNFKVGDWVMVESFYETTLEQIVSIQDDEIETSNNVILKDSELKINIWEPKIGDLIFDRYVGGLGKITFVDELSISYVDVIGDYGDVYTTGHKYIEPFVGKLPSWYKGE